jgi:hypothetical protein
MYKYLKDNFRDYIFIILTATIFYGILFSKSLASNVFVVDNVIVEGKMDINFSRKEYIDKAFKESFNILKSKILLNKDLYKVNNVNLNSIKKLIIRFQIVEESYNKKKYKATFKIFYDDNKVKKLLKSKNISFSQPENINVIFFPILFINNEVQSLDENFFYKKWSDAKVFNESIKFILPIDDLEDFSKIKKMENNIEELNISDFIDKYNISNYAFSIMNYEQKNLSIHIKTNFNNSKNTKNISYKNININDEKVLKPILIEIKKILIETWKEANVINLLMPLSIKLKFLHGNLSDFDKLKNTFSKINIIDNFILEEFNTSYSFFKIYYYGNPKKLKNEFKKFGYNLINEQGYWELNFNE